jgi:hypothetical protein
VTLREIQELFWRAIAWPTGVEAFLAQADDATQRAFAATFADTPDFDRVSRMRVYAEAYFWRLYEVVVDQLPLTAWLAGGPRFHDFVTDYVLHHPSHDPDIRRFAASLPAVLRDHPLERDLPGLADVAAVEWAIVSAVDAPDDALLTADALSTVEASQWPTRRLHAVRTASLVVCRPDFHALMTLKATDAPPPSTIPLADHTILVWRQPNLDVHYRPLAPSEARALQALLAGHTFADLCNAAAEATPQRVVHWLHRWLRDGLLAARP